MTGRERIGPEIESGSPWARHIGAPIRRTACYWERLELGPAVQADGSIVGSARAVDLPTALRVDLDTGAAWFVAAIPQAPEMDRVFAPGDEIMVVFSREKMRDMGDDDAVFLQ